MRRTVVLLSVVLIALTQGPALGSSSPGDASNFDVILFLPIRDEINIDDNILIDSWSQAITLFGRGSVTAIARDGSDGNNPPDLIHYIDHRSDRIHELVSHGSGSGVALEVYDDEHVAEDRRTELIGEGWDPTHLYVGGTSTGKWTVSVTLSGLSARMHVEEGVQQEDGLFFMSWCNSFYGIHHYLENPPVGHANTGPVWFGYPANCPAGTADADLATFSKGATCGLYPTVNNAVFDYLPALSISVAGNTHMRFVPGMSCKIAAAAFLHSWVEGNVVYWAVIQENSGLQPSLYRIEGRDSDGRPFTLIDNVPGNPTSTPTTLHTHSRELPSQAYGSYVRVVEWDGALETLGPWVRENDTPVPSRRDEILALDGVDVLTFDEVVHRERLQRWYTMDESLELKEVAHARTAGGSSAAGSITPADVLIVAPYSSWLVNPVTTVVVGSNGELSVVGVTTTMDPASIKALHKTLADANRDWNQSHPSGPFYDEQPELNIVTDEPVYLAFGEGTVEQCAPRIACHSITDLVDHDGDGFPDAPPPTEYMVGTSDESDGLAEVNAVSWNARNWNALNNVYLENGPVILGHDGIDENDADGALREALTNLSDRYPSAELEFRSGHTSNTAAVAAAAQKINQGTPLIWLKGTGTSEEDWPLISQNPGNELTLDQISLFFSPSCAVLRMGSPVHDRTAPKLNAATDGTAASAVVGQLNPDYGSNHREFITALAVAAANAPEGTSLARVLWDAMLLVPHLEDYIRGMTISGVWTKWHEIALIGVPEVTPVGDETLSFARWESPQPGFGDKTHIAFTLRESARVKLGVYDVAGRLVANLLENRGLTAGGHTTVWDGRNTSGSRVSSGIYFLKLEVVNPDHTAVLANRRILVTR